ncbi:MAG: HAMP domain-containing sensor histidine kinase [Bacilli bacterium]|nr:HAMP domain-containing sensor histidine kinase [Bacilli bacterium]
MRKNILFLLMGTSLIVTIALSLIFSHKNYNSDIEIIEHNLAIYINLYDSSISLDNQGALELSNSLDGVEVTFLDLSGFVIGSSNPDISGDLSQFEEISEALNFGVGNSVRASLTDRIKKVFYCETKDTVLIRFAFPLVSPLAYFINYIPSILWFLIFLLIVNFFVSYILVDTNLRIVQKYIIDSFRNSDKNVEPKYFEMTNIANVMNNYKKRIEEKFKDFEENLKITAIVLDSMENGILIFKSFSDVIYINKTASKLLKHYEKDVYIMYLLDDDEINRAIIKKENNVFYRVIEDNEYAFSFSFSKEFSILLITDVTLIRKAEKSKNEFISNVTHEMNTPLTSIRGFAELILTGQLPKTNINSAAQTILTQSDRLKNLIASIINYSAIDNDELPSYDINISEIAKKTISSMEPLIKEKNIDLNVNIEEDVFIESRQERIVEIFSNLISNAIRYNKQGGKLYIEISKKEVPKIVVEDTGIGISKENMDRIFDRFYTVDKSHNGVEGGFGLGLAIVKKLAQKAGWKINLKSEVNKGTKFEILFYKNKCNLK